ncbi:hypothetical protein G5I_11153 [Acromyrmex echinatior]|uniref:Uncharacterized protein n=1 Tax=Acromyrmex echinatior TaxID=103372 RepID=F4WYT9_ACREC|nr:hypothetical protein G5I_11153 [Acromyrmex echinatior]
MREINSDVTVTRNSVTQRGVVNIRATLLSGYHSHGEVRVERNGNGLGRVLCIVELSYHFLRVAREENESGRKEYGLRRAVQQPQGANTCWTSSYLDYISGIQAGT